MTNLKIFSDIGHVELNELSVTITNGLDVGDWGAWDTCPTGSYAAGIQLQVLSLTVLVATIDAKWEGMGDVGSARYEPALLPPCPDHKGFKV